MSGASEQMNGQVIFSLSEPQYIGSVSFSDDEYCFFLDATTHLYRRSFPSIRPSVHPSVRLSVHPAAGPSQVIFKRRKSSLLSVGNLSVINDNVTMSDEGVVASYVPRVCSLRRKDQIFSSLIGHLLFFCAFFPNFYGVLFC